MSELTEKISGRETIYIYFELQAWEQPQWTRTSICFLAAPKPNSAIRSYSRDVWFLGTRSTSQSPSEVFVTTLAKALFPCQSWDSVTASSTRAKPPAAHPSSHGQPKPAVPGLWSLPRGFAQGCSEKSSEASWRLSVYYIPEVTLMAKKLGSKIWETLDRDLFLNLPEIGRVLPQPSSMCMQLNACIGKLRGMLKQTRMP